MKSNPPDDLAAAIERARPRLGRLASTMLFFETIGSTNDEAAARSAKAFALHERSAFARHERSASLSGERPPEGLVVVADQQTAGRGRRGHTWFSPPGSGLYVSVVLAPAAARVDPARATTLLTLAAGVALAEGIEQATGLRVDLKWPNDLQMTRRKLGGILAESSGAGGERATVVVGYGINVLASAFPPELRDRATSLESELGRAIDRHHLLAETLAALSRRYEDLLAGRFDAILDAWRRLAPAASGARVAWTTNAGTATGVTAGIDDLGALLVRIDDRVERIVSGEVSWL
ncbi:MAG TPA: biotin--[acetyl-CoA-carboxylase] ligase [Vicinamibacterales bacterium]|nr:biotin--[acetyl-CoA-carboxylase] ligase [Vicinamibacterales bacterium]